MHDKAGYPRGSELLWPSCVSIQEILCPTKGIKGASRMHIRDNDKTTEIERRRETKPSRAGFVSLLLKTRSEEGISTQAI
jgi:hypothetical protein